MIPKKINITTDENVLEYVETKTKDSKGAKLTKPEHIYQYTKSKTKLGETINLTDEGIERLIDNCKLFK